MQTAVLDWNQKLYCCLLNMDHLGYSILVLYLSEGNFLNLHIHVLQQWHSSLSKLPSLVILRKIRCSPAMIKQRFSYSSRYNCSCFLWLHTFYSINISWKVTSLTSDIPPNHKSSHAGWDILLYATQQMFHNPHLQCCYWKTSILSRLVIKHSGLVFRR